MNNTEYEMFSRLCDDIHRIADHFAPEDQDNSVNAMVGGAFQGASMALEEVLDAGQDPFNKAEKLRALVSRWRELSDEYYKRQADTDKKQRTQSQEATQTSRD